MSKQPVSRMCPNCRGNGISGMNILGADKICTKCGGKGTIIDFVDVPDERPQRTTSHSSTSSSNSGDGATVLGCIAIVIAMFVIMLGITFAPFIYAGLLLYFGFYVGRKGISYWLKFG